ncbi:MAG TPA: hypothetical protein VGM39_09305 [Kofleriaceae bacterium]|jgi:hypothetical protein
MLTTIDTTNLDNITGGTVRASSSDATLQALQQTLTQLQSSQNTNQSGFNNPMTMLMFAMLASEPRNNSVVYVGRRGWGGCW